MKFLNVGDNFDNLNIELKAAKLGNKFGTLFYCEKIRLSTVNPVADYNVWTSKDGNLFLCICFESGIRDNLLKIVDLVTQNHPNLVFKELESDVMYCKIKPEVACTIALNEMLNV